MLLFSNFCLSFISENRPFVCFFAQFITRLIEDNIYYGYISKLLH